LRFTAEAGARLTFILQPARTPWCGVNGRMKKLNLPILSVEEVENLVFGVMNESQQALFKKNLEIDFSTKLSNDVRFRVNAFHQINGVSCAFRVIPNEIKSYDELHLPDILKRLTSKEKGLILVTVPPVAENQPPGHYD
jgi:twitching motility protein PilT